MGGCGKQLDRLDIRHGVDDLACQGGARARPRLRPHANARHVVPDQEAITHHPAQQTGRNPPIHGAQQEDCPHHRRQRKQHRVHDLCDRIIHGPACLHLFLGNPPGEIIVEEGDRLTQSEPMQPRQHKVHHIGLHHDRLHVGVEPQQNRPDHKKERHAAQQKRGIPRENRIRARVQRPVDHRAQKDRSNHFGHASNDRQQRGSEQHALCPFEAPFEKGQKGARWCTFRRLKRVYPGQYLHSAASLGSIPIKPPDCRAQKPA